MWYLLAYDTYSESTGWIRHSFINVHRPHSIVVAVRPINGRFKKINVKILPCRDCHKLAAVYSCYYALLHYNILYYIALHCIALHFCYIFVVMLYY